MDAPKCRVCGVKHWGSEHKWPKEVAASAVVDDRNGLTLMVPPDTVVYFTLPGEPAEDKAAKRRAYLRDYMRKRRGGGANKISDDLENKSVK